MPRAIVLLLAMASCSSAQAGELDGHYRTTLDGQPSELILRQNDAVVEGGPATGEHERHLCQRDAQRQHRCA
jgi:hypothetical protein